MQRILCPRFLAASTKSFSLSAVRACKGVLVRWMDTLQFSRSAASIMAMDGGGSVLFQ